MKGLPAGVATVLLALSMTGCPEFRILVDGRIDPATGSVYYRDSNLVVPGGLKAYGNAFIKFRNKKGGDGAFGFVSSPFDLWAPFRWEASTATYDPKSNGPGTGIACTELDVRGSSPLEFYAICARKESGGYTCWVAKAGTSVVAQVFLSATGIAKMAVEHDGENLVFMVKKPSDPAWTTITTIPHSQTAAFVPSIGFAQAPAGAQADFDDLRIVSNGPLPGGASQEQVLARVVIDAVSPLGNAVRALDDGGIDLTAAGGFLEDAIAQLPAAETTVAAGAAGLANPEAGAAAVKRIRSARKDTEKAAKLYEKGKSFKPIAVALQKAMGDAFGAAQSLDPHTLPGQ
jgi:hypothetical protein